MNKSQKAYLINVKHGLTCDKIKELIDDERKAHIEYKKLGLSKLSKDEGRHKTFLEKLDKSMECKL